MRQGQIAARQARLALTQVDVEAILRLDEDAYYVDGETGLVDFTFHYGLTHRTSVYLSLSAYDFGGGFLDRTIEDFHQVTENLKNYENTPDIGVSVTLAWVSLR